MHLVWTKFTTALSIFFSEVERICPAGVRVLRRLWTFIGSYVDSWSDDRVPRQSAAIAYYALFSMAPLLLLTRLIIGRTLGPVNLEHGLHERLQEFMGAPAAVQLERLAGDVTLWKGNTPTAVLGAATLMYGATGVFVELKDSLNMIWGLRRREGKSIILFLKDRLLSFGMVLFFGMLLMLSVVTTGVFSVFQGWMQMHMKLPVATWSMAALFIAMATETLLFAVIFKVLPDIKFPWRDVWLGALVTAILFEAGKWGLGWYLGRESTFATVGKTGSVVLLLIWVYYSSMIVLAGAEFIEINQRLKGTKHGRKRALAAGQGPPEDDAYSPIERSDGLSS